MTGASKHSSKLLVSIPSQWQVQRLLIPVNIVVSVIVGSMLAGRLQTH